MGIGLALFAVHNIHQPFIEYLFLPNVGLALVTICVFAGLHFYGINPGPKWVWIPMLVIVASLWLRLMVDFSYATVAGGVTGLLLFGVYLTSRTLGKEVLEIFLPLVIFEAISVITLGILHPGARNGGIITSHNNYDIGAGFLILGLLFSSFRQQWWLSALVLVALFFTGAEEGWFAVAILGIVLLIKRDWSKKLLIPAIALTITVVVCTPLGITEKLYSPTSQKVVMAKEAVEDNKVAQTVGKVIPSAVLNKINQIENDIGADKKENPLEIASNYRWEALLTSLRSTKPLGHGLNLTAFYKGIPHNTLAIINHQIGPAGAIAWLIIMGYLLIKTRRKYLVVGILALSVFDHYIWTQIAPWWWTVTGVITTSGDANDYIFRSRTEAQTISPIMEEA